MESWEFQNNVTMLMNFQTDFFDETMQADPTTGESKEKWRYDYEARFPEDTWTDYSKLQELHTFIISTYQEQATGETLSEPYTDIDGNTHNVDNAAYRLAKFRTEFGNYAEVDSFIFYYIFTELFLMVDSRAKNLFIGFSGSDADPEICHAIDRKAVAEPYDMDTAIGTNNEGSLVFGYSYEDTDHLDGGADVFNGQNSVLWNNIRDAFPTEIVQMYQRLRSEGILSYASVEKRFEDHQAKWSEAIFNDDAQFKYLDPLVNPDPGKEPTDVYLPMLQGSKAEQRKWWLYNRFRYMDSKWNAGDALSDVIQLRGYAKADITVTPYADIYTTIKYGSYMVSGRGRHGVPQTLACPLDNVNDTEIYVYSASQLASVGDLSGLKVGFADFSKATKLQSIKVGDGTVGYANGNLTGLNVGTNPLLGSVDARNCTALSGTVDLSGAANIETVLFEGTALTACSLPNGGILKTLHLPGTVTNLTVRNQTSITDFSMPDYSGISTLRLENTKGIPLGDILAEADNLTRVRIVDMEWTCPTADGFAAIIEKMKAAGGLDEAGGNTDSAVVTGIVRVSETVPASVLTDVTEHFPELVVFSNGAAACTVRYRNYDGSLVYTQSVAYGANAPDPVSNGLISAPVRPANGRTGYVYAGWDTALTNIRSNLTITAVFDTVLAYLVRFLNWDESELYSVYIAEGLHCPDPVTTGLISRPTRPTTETTVYNYMGWDRSLLNITADREIRARYSEEVSLKVTFANYDGTVLYTAYVASGASAPDPVLAGFIQRPTREPDATYLYEYKGWSTALTNITASKTITATYTSYQYFTATFNNWDGSLLFAQKVKKNGPVTDPARAGLIPTPAREPDEGEDFHYIYKGWDKALSASLTANVTYTAQFKTDQVFTVSFVNYDNAILDTQYVLDEDAAVNPVTTGRIATPYRPSTAQYDYTFSGWNKTFASIKADTTVTASYSSKTRSYTVRFWDGATLLQTATVLYNGSVSYQGETPEKNGAVFTGWNPATTNIKGDTDSYIVWNAETITDSWDEIFAAEADGSYAEKYHVGDSKYIDLGEEGVNIMRLVAMSADPLAEGSGFAKMTWVSDYLLKTHYSFNPAVRLEADTEIGPTFAPTTVANEWKSTTAYISNNTGGGTWTFTAADTAVVTLYCKTTTQYTTHQKISVTVNGTAWKTNAAASAYTNKAYKLEAGETLTVEVSFTNVYNDDYNGFFKYAVSDANNVTVDVDIDDGTIVKEILGYVEGTGGIGGWEHSHLREAFTDAVWPVIPENIRNSIKTVTKYSKVYSTAPSPAGSTVGTSDQIWVPSYREIVGGNSVDSAAGPAYTSYFDSTALRIKNKPYASAVSYYLRSASDKRYIRIITADGGTATVATANSSYPVLLGFCT